MLPKLFLNYLKNFTIWKKNILLSKWKYFDLNNINIFFREKRVSQVSEETNKPDSRAPSRSTPRR